MIVQSHAGYSRSGTIGCRPPVIRMIPPYHSDHLTMVRVGNGPGGLTPVVYLSRSSLGLGGTSASDTIPCVRAMQNNGRDRTSLESWPRYSP